MSGDDSFDPRSWGGGAPKPPEPPASARPDAAGPLPDMWKSVADQDQPVAPPPAPPTPPPTPPRPPLGEPRLRGSRRWMPYVASLAILAAGAGLAWTMRSQAPPVPLETGAATDAPAAESPAAAAKPDETATSRSLVIASAADLGSTLTAAGLGPGEAAAATAAASQAMTGAKGEIRIVLNLVGSGSAMHLDRLQASFVDGSGAVIARDPAGKFAATRVAAELSKQIKIVRGELDSDSFYTSAVSAGVTDSLIPDFVNAFQFDFNLAADVSPGDTFEVAYEQAVTADGQPVGQPQLLYASLVTATKRRALYRFKPTDEEAGWFDGNGASTVRAFMRTPIQGARVTSNFGMRFHPVLHYTRLHGGTDFAAPVGTPIYASADGTILTAGPSGGCAGTRVILQHKDGIQTYYFHMSHIADGMTVGAPIKQGTSVGLSGATGGCITGPHLHYEVHVNGEKVDPMTVVSDASRKALEDTGLAAFKAQRDRVDVARARQGQ